MNKDEIEIRCQKCLQITVVPIYEEFFICSHCHQKNQIHGAELEKKRDWFFKKDFRHETCET